MTPSQAEKDGWPVSVYRKVDLEWQKMQPRNSRGRNAVVRATPQLNCIVLHRIQVRLRLGPEVQEKQEAILPSTRRATDKSSSLVVRRRDCILISSKEGARSLVLKFRDRKSCHEFSDFLVQLNPSLARTMEAGTSLHVDTSSSSSSDRTNSRSSDNVEGALVHTAREDEQMRSILGRLLLSDDFHELVDSVEDCLRRSNDGGALLAALANERVYPIMRANHSDNDGQA